MSRKSQRGRGQTSSSPGRSKSPKRIVEGRKRKTKLATLQCGQCGAYFESLSQINQHYKAVGHKRKKSKPKQMRFSKNYSDNDILIMEAIWELLKDPIRMKKAIRESMNKRRFKQFEQFG